MSRLAQALLPKDTGNCKAASKKLKHVQIIEESTTLPHLDYLREYTIEARIATRIQISSINAPEVLAEAVRDVRKQIVEEIFGEFRHLILDLKVALYDDDRYKAKNIITKLEYQMFYEGLE